MKVSTKIATPAPKSAFKPGYKIVNDIQGISGIITSVTTAHVYIKVIAHPYLSSGAKFARSKEEIMQNPSYKIL